MSEASNRRIRLNFRRKIDGKRHPFREILCWFGRHSESCFSECKTHDRWCWGEDF
jgi:hypothetical protein